MATEAMESGNSAVEEQPTLNPEGASTTETNPAESVQPSTQTGASGNVEAGDCDEAQQQQAKQEIDNEKTAEGKTEDDQKEEIPDSNKDEVKNDEGSPDGNKEEAKENTDGDEGVKSELKTTPDEGNADGNEWKEKEWKTTNDEGNADGDEWKEKEWKTTNDEGNADGDEWKEKEWKTTNDEGKADGDEWKEKEWKTTPDEGNAYGDDWKNEWKGNEWKGDEWKGEEWKQDEWKTNGDEKSADVEKSKETPEAEGSCPASFPSAEGLGAPPGLSLEPANDETNEYGWQNWDAQNTASDTSVPKPKAAEDETEEMDWSTFRATAEAKDDSETHWLEADQAKGLLNGPMSQGKPVAASARDRICALTGVEMKMEEPWSGIPVTLTIKSDDAEKRRLAYKYARIAGKAHAQQMWTDVQETDDDGDLSTLEFPQSMQFVFGRQGAKLAQVGEGSNTLLFFMNDENAAKKPAAPWLGVGKRVEVKQVGDVRTDNWHTGTVAEVQRSGSARVKLDSGADCIADIKNARPRFELKDEVEVQQEGDTWQQAVVEERKDSGTLVVRLPAATEEGEGTTQEVEPTAARPRTQAKDGEEETAEAPEPTSRIAIFGAFQDRALAQLRLMASVAMKWPDYYKDYRAEWGAPADTDWGSEVMEIDQHFLPQCVGQKGQMRRKLSRAAEVLIEYVGNTAYVCGPKEQRCFGAALIKILCSSDKGNVNDVPEEALPHTSIVLIPEDSVSFVMGSKRSFMSRIEEEEGVIVFLGPPAEKKEDQSGQGGWGGNSGWGEGGWNESSWNEGGDSKWNESDWQQGGGGASTEEGEQATEKTKEEAQEEKKEEEKQEEEKKEEETEEKEDKDQEKKEEDKDEKKEEKKEEKEEEKEAEEEKKEEEQADVRKVYIFAYTSRSRTMATLRVQSAVESKNPGYCTEGVVACTSNEDGFDKDICEVPADAISFVMGKQGATKKKLQAAAGCGLEYIGSFAYILGTREERERGRQYLEWLQLQRGGSDHTIELPKSMFSERTDVTMVTLSTAERQLLDTQTLTTIEQNTSTFMQFRVPTSEEIFIPGAIVELSRQGRSVTAEVLSVADNEDGSLQLRFCKDANQYADTEEANAELLIFGHDAGENGQSGRSLAEKQVWEAVAQAQGGAGAGDENGWDSWGGDHEKDQSKEWGQDKGQEEWSWGGGKDGATWEDSKDKWEEENKDDYNANNNSAHNYNQGRNKNQNYNQHNTNSDHDYKNNHDDNSKQYSKGSNHYQNNSQNHDDKYYNNNNNHNNNTNNNKNNTNNHNNNNDNNNSNTNHTNSYNNSGHNKTAGASEEQGWGGHWGEADEWYANGAGRSNDRSRAGDRSGAGNRNQEKAKWSNDDAAEGRSHWSGGGNRQDKQGGHNNEESGDGNSAWANWKGCAASLSEWGDGGEKEAKWQGAEKTHNENPWDNWGGGAGADKSKNDDAWEGWGAGWGANKRQGRR